MSAATIAGATALRPSPPADPAPPALHLRRSTAGSAAAGPVALGQLAYGDGADCRRGGSGVVLARVPAPVLDAGGRVDTLVGDTAVRDGQFGCVAWRHDGHWLFGHATLAESDLARLRESDPAALRDDADETPLEALSRRIYEDVFATLAATGYAQLQRLWNYVPDINAHSHGLERYRQFNSGRQRAFLAAGRAAFVGAPAACALGAGDAKDGLRVSFLAGRRAAWPVENPRQVSAYHYPREFGPRSPTFSRAALSDVGGGRLALFVSGTASIVGHQSLHAGDVAAQTREAVANLRAVVGAADARCGAGYTVEGLQAVVYVRAATDLARVRAVLQQELGADAPLLRDAVWLQADVCREELLVEIEGHAVRPGRLPATEAAP